MKILILPMLVFVLACNKEKVVIPDARAKGAQLAFKMESPFNPENPADTIGIIHNEALDFVYKKLSAKQDFSDSLKKKYTLKFLEKRYGHSVSAQITKRALQRLKYKEVPITKLTQVLSYGPVLSQNINSILSAAQQIKSPQDYTGFKHKILSIETNIINGKIRISRMEAEQLLHFTSIMRHSMWFWIDAISHNRDRSDPQFLRGFIKAILGSLSDAHGALVSVFTYHNFRYMLEDAALDSAITLWAFGY